MNILSLLLGQAMVRGGGEEGADDDGGGLM